MSADVAQPPSPPRISGSRRSSDQQISSGSSSLRLTGSDDQHEKKSSPPVSSSYLRRGRRRSDCTETGSIGYGSSAPLESETSYSSHPGYPSKAPAAQPKSPRISGEIQVVPQPQIHHHSHQNPQTSSPSSASQSSSTPSSGAYVDVSSSARLAGVAGSTTTSNGTRRPKKAVVKSRTAELSTGPSSLSWNGSLAAERETGYVVDSEKGNAYYKGHLLGKGGFARVYLITDIATRKQYACKIIPKHQMQKIHMQKIAREIMIHKELNHVNVVQMHHYFEDTLNVYMLLEACPKKSLVDVLKYRGHVSEPEARYYMKQMVTGVAYIHSQKVIHRDLKPGNMFLSEKMIVKIGDFGLATQSDGQRRRVTICGTPNFIAPEVLFKQSYSYEADVWALGCILYVLLVGQPPFDSSTLKETYSRICNHRYKELDDTMASRAGQELVRWLLQPNPELRLPLDLVKEHPYLTQEYVPSTLPDSCCYQAPRLPFAEKTSALTSFSSSLNFSPAQRNINQQQANPQLVQAIQSQNNQAAAQSQDGKKLKKKKKKVSSWLASWRLPKLPRFRQRISSVLCLESRKKQQQVLGVGVADGTANFSGAQVQLMSHALEDCLAAVAKSTVNKTRCNPSLVDDFAPLFITKWIDYSNKYGLAFQLSDRSVGVLFNDSTKMSYTHDRKRVEYTTADDEITRYNRERNVPTHLQKKLELLLHFTDYMDKHLTEGGEVTERAEGQDAVRRASRTNSVPLMRRWLRTSKAIIMELSGPLLQMNFFDDHTKLIVSQELPPQQQPAHGGSSRSGYLVTYIDCDRRASTYWLNDLRDYGCAPELHERLLYVHKVAKEFAELDAGQRN
ncbi:serine/threonine-protein kinase PLK1 isoform X1 [Nasonia vitripennis]|uniref:Serine/threonine-protein kinase PLK n=1 Tax=Nasonia vitripennis TaxID=7425 RepID=A0A7M7G7G0_NASVI|nr:serine/threonine-protein kinase PLK1 isoform X1 [Nasonia vitripennis]